MRIDSPGKPPKLEEILVEVKLSSEEETVISRATLQAGAIVAGPSCS